MHYTRVPVLVPASALAMCLGLLWLVVGRSSATVSLLGLAEASQIWGGTCDTKYIQPQNDTQCNMTVSPSCEPPGTCQHCGGQCPLQHTWVLGGQTSYNNVDYFQQAHCPDYVPNQKKCYQLSCICDDGQPWTGYQCGFYGPTYAYCP